MDARRGAPAPRLPQAGRVTLLLLPLLLVVPVFVLAAAVAALWAYGPLGWLAAVLLVVGVLWATRLAARICLRWWRSTKAPVRGS